MRYIIKSGRFGKYFYDTRTNADLDLEKVLSLLNGLTEKNKDWIILDNKKRIEYLQGLIDKASINTKDGFDELETRLEHHADMIYNKLVRKEGVDDDGEKCFFEQDGWCLQLKIDCINYNEPCDDFVDKDKREEVMIPK